jgi:hypothetical protein
VDVRQQFRHHRVETYGKNRRGLQKVTGRYTVQSSGPFCQVEALFRTEILDQIVLTAVERNTFVIVKVFVALQNRFSGGLRADNTISLDPVFLLKSYRCFHGLTDVDSITRAGSVATLTEERLPLSDIFASHALLSRRASA